MENSTGRNIVPCGTPTSIPLWSESQKREHNLNDSKTFLTEGYISMKVTVPDWSILSLMDVASPSLFCIIKFLCFTRLVQIDLESYYGIVVKCRMVEWGLG